MGVGSWSRYIVTTRIKSRDSDRPPVTLAVTRDMKTLHLLLNTGPPAIKPCVSPQDSRGAGARRAASEGLKPS